MSGRIAIASAARTPMDTFQGELASLTAPQLGITVIRAMVKRTGLKPEQIEEVIMGCVPPAGQGQAPAHQAALGAGLLPSVGCVMVNRMYGSDMRAAMDAYDALLASPVDAVVAGGMKSMTNVPHLIPKDRGGYRIGHDVIYDHMTLDGLEDAYDKGHAIGTFGEDCAEKYDFTCEAQDHFAMTSVRRAQETAKSGAFRWEVTPVTVPSRTGDTIIDTDEGPRRIKVDRIPSLKPAFKKDGVMTAALPSPINDGVAALVMTRESTARQLGITSLVVMPGHIIYAQVPGWFTTALVTTIDKLFKKLDWNSGNVDLSEIDEAFAVVPTAATHDLHIPYEKVNVNGGVCALGHPTDAFGARVIATLLGALQHRGGKRGVASLCIGGGGAMAVDIEPY